MQGKMVGKLTSHKGRLKLNFQTASCIHIRAAISIGEDEIELVIFEYISRS